ncbi:MAG: YceI family protein [bacterium]
MKQMTIAVLLFFFGIALNAQSTKWNVDEAHSKISFSVTHMMITDVEGKFNKYEAEIISDKNDFSDAKVNFKIDVKSIDTDNDKRDDHLRSPDFFDSDKFHYITFISDKMTKKSKGKYKLSGDFTMLGVTKKIILDVTYNGMKNDPWGNLRAGFKISGTINRNDWGLKYNSALDAGAVMIGEEVEILCNLELIKATK